MNKKVTTLVLTGYGINCEAETAECFKRAGSESTVLHINELIKDPKQIHNYHILGIPGGFSYGDHIASGKIFANKLKLFLKTELDLFIKQGKGVLGICNGFQVLVKSGILPNCKGLSDEETSHSQQVSITHNEQGRFEDRWVKLKVNTNNPSFWLNGPWSEFDFELPIRHGEGRFVVENPDNLATILSQNLHAFSYQNDLGETTLDYPQNPNGSMAGIAGITNPVGNVLGLMPHPEAYMEAFQRPNYQCHQLRTPNHLEPAEFTEGRVGEEGMGMQIFRNGVKAMANL